jgi:DDE superfamily endonuclease
VEGLGDFREELYACYTRRADALFELCDAVLSAGNVPSPPHLSLAPIHRRGWGSLYAALSKGRIDAEALRELLAFHGSDAEGTPVYAVDVSSWPRCDAETSPQRGYLYHPSRHSAGQPIVVGWAYQLIAGLSFERDSWVAPVDGRQVEPAEDTDKVAAKQIRQLVDRQAKCDGEPLFVFDGGYDPVRLQFDLQEEGVAAQILVRLKPNRTFYFDPVVPEKKPVGHPYCHGKKFDLKDAETWPEPTHEHLCRTDAYGAVRVRAWSGLHPKTRRSEERYGSKSACVVKGTVVLVQVGRLPQGERRRKPSVVADRRLPWEKPLPARKLTPYRVLRSFATLLPALDTPAAAPKPRGRSPGRPKGSLSGRAKRFPAVKKAA